MYMHTYIHTCADLGSLPNGVISVRVSKMLTLVLPPLWPHKVADPAERCLSPRIIVFITHSPRCWGTHSEHSAMETEGISRSSVVGLSRTRTTVFLLSPLSLRVSLFSSLSLCASIPVWFYMYVCICICGGQRTTLGAMRQVLSTVLFLWYRISLAWNSPGRVISLSRDPKHPPAFASSYWVPSAHYHPWLCLFKNVVSGDWTHTLMLARQLLYQLNY